MISVIIPTYERPQKVADAIKSVKRQSFTDIEILIVDDNGLETVNQLETHKVVSEFSDPRIRYVAHEKNKGGCAARNTGIKEAKGEYVAFLDDDDVWSKRFLEEMMQTISKHRNGRCGAAYCDFYSYDGAYSVKFKRPVYYEGNVYLKLLAGWCPASTSLFLIKKDDIVSAGLFDESLTSFQDYDMWLRLSKVTDFCYCSNPLVVKYEGVGEQTSKNPQRRFKGLDTLSKKYDSTLQGEERELFQKAKNAHYSSALYNRILYNHAHNIPYKEDSREYIKIYGGKGASIHLFMRLHFPCGLRRLMTRLAGSTKGLIYYKGLYPLD